MKQLSRGLIEIAPILLVSIGVIVLMLGAAGGIAVNNVPLQIRNGIGQIIICGIGLALIGWGIRLAWRRQ